MKSLKSSFLGVGVLISLALVVRVWGLAWGAPYFRYQPNEERTLFAIQQLIPWHLIEFSTSQPSVDQSFYTYLVASLFTLVHIALVAMGFFHTLGSQKFSPELYYGIARGTTALLGSMTVFFTYLIGRTLFSREVGWLAAIFLAVIPLHVLHSHYATPEVSVAFLTTLTFLFLGLFYTHQKVHYYLFAGLFIGVGMTMNYGVGWLFLTGLLAYFWKPGSVRKESAGRFSGENLLWILVFLFLGLTAFMLLQAVFNWQVLWKEYEQQGVSSLLIAFVKSIDVGNFALGVPTNLSAFSKRGLFYLGSILKGMTVYLAIPALGGIVYSFLNPSHQRIVLLSFPVLYLILLSQGKQPLLEQHIVIILPFLALLATEFLVRIVPQEFIAQKTAGHKQKVVYGLLLAGCYLLILPAFYQVLRMDYLFWQKDTRTFATEWILQNVPENSRIALEHYTPYIPMDRYQVSYSFSLADRALESYQENQTDYLITSDAVYNRYFQEGEEAYPEKILFYQELDASYQLIKTFQLESMDFLNPVIKIYQNTLRDPDQVKFSQAPLQESTPQEFYFLDTTRSGKDLGGFLVNPGATVRKNIFSSVPLEALGILIFNGKTEQVMGLKIGYKKQTLNLKPGEQKLLVVKPSRSFPFIRYFYQLEVSSDLQGNGFVRIATDPLNLGLFQFDAKARDAAIQSFEKAIAEDPQNPLARYYLGVIYQKNQNVDQACKHLTQLNKEKLQDFYPAQYEGERYAHRTGRNIEEVNASSNQTAYFDAQRDKPGYLIFGNYKHFPPGMYQAYFRMKMGNQKEGQEVVTLEVTRSAREVIARKTIRTSDFNEPFVYQDFPITFVNDGFEELEFRTWVFGNADLWLDKISVDLDLSHMLAPCHVKQALTP